jgi:signal peptidase II
MSRAWRWFAAAATLVVADQISKAVVLAMLAPGTRTEVTPFFNLVLVFNKGAAFSFLADMPGWQRWVFAGFAAVAAVIVSTLLLKNSHKILFSTGLTLILGGAVGNLIDRLRFGHVVDFLDFHAMGWHWPAFNVADSAITVGALLLILESFVHHDKRAGASS